MATIFGTNANNVIYGTNRGDLIDGRGGSDRIDGRGGDDRMIGGPGGDTFIFGFRSGNDGILDFEADDRISTGRRLPSEEGFVFLDDGILKLADGGSVDLGDVETLRAVGRNTYAAAELPGEPEPGPQPGPTPPPPAGGEIAEANARINDIREDAGARPVTMNPALTRAAQEHAEDMAENRYFSHTGRDGSSPGDRIEEAGYQGRGTIALEHKTVY